MTLTQYLVAWMVYILASLGCLAVWWRMTRGFGPALSAWLRLFAAVLVLTPGLTSPDMHYMSPAFLGALFDGLTNGPEAMMRNGILLGGVLIIVSVGKILFFRSPKKRATRKDTSHRSNPGQRIEPKAH
ncbi:hypothetical protein M3P05_01565 [Sansalvadorimonas sp. 2012CJ34-2]|uniref:Integral membrane protein n=1 Tax=Parendozoicomonas callyspongiae TaxID=2942213 RepID=A0ABT0PBK6_9GAMM|nr:hypothetical protein [Sansalvadorimonas sp. 2012CJ34-2]MCL6268641.1 hypothetical protein [Sansalvadorimonas sp. 2012CJ34-2]